MGACPVTELCTLLLPSSGDVLEPMNSRSGITVKVKANFHTHPCPLRRITSLSFLFLCML